MGKSVLFISVVEFHKSGIPHLHILIQCYIPQAWISENWEALGGGRIVHIEAIRDLHRISYYLSKYLAKDVILSAPWGTRRYSTSRDILLFEKRTASGWWLIKCGISLLHAAACGDAFAEQYDYDGLLRSFASASDLERLIAVI
ncbi:MAG: hypothetical protein NTX17_03010 [Candidatus Eisenbacteria bacterium]|nr:hypothetical protein [Candidatus Eisenbacteria bacterium]